MIKNVLFNTAEMQGEKSSQASKMVCFFGFIVLPFVVLYWLVPVFSDLTIGNDYPLYSIQAQMELAYSLEHHSFPLYAPGFAGGQSAAALTLGQVYHPILHIARWIPGYWDGDALKINTILKLLSLGLCHFLVFYLLRRLGLNIVGALVLSFITVYNMRMLDSFRYGASLENYTAFICLSSFAILRYLSPGSWAVNSGIVLSAYLLAVGGHPQAFYLGFLGAAIVTLAAPFFVKALKPEVADDFRYLSNYWSGVLLLTIAGALLAAPYMLSFYFEFVSGNTMRAENTYQWSTIYQDSWGGALRNFYAPLKADVHGGFGGSSLIVLLVMLPVIALYRQKIPAGILLSMALFVTFFLVCIGDATPLHYGVWKFIPLADKFRTPGRFSLWLIFPVLFVLAWLFKEGCSRTIAIGSQVRLSPLMLISGLATLLFIVFSLGFDSLLPASGVFAPESFLKLPKAIHNSMFCAGLVSLILCFVYSCLDSKRRRLYSVVGFLLVVSVIAQLTLALRHGTWQTVEEPQKTLTQMNQEKRQNFKLYSVPGFGMTTSTFDEQIERSILEPKIARIYRTVVTIQDEDEMWDYLSSKRSPHDAVVIADASLALTAAENPVPETVTLHEASYNQLVFDVSTAVPAFISTNMPFRDNWRASIDGNYADIYRANGNETGIFIPEGKHRVVFAYESPMTVMGAVISGVTLFCLLLFAAWQVTGRNRALLVALAIVVPLTIFYAWYHSLYHGLPIATTYEWSSADLPAKNNLAYSKQTSSSSVYNYQMPFFFYSGLAVDGDVSGAPFASVKSNRPSWKVDLGGRSKVDKIRIHDLNKRSLPVTILVADHSESYHAIGQIKSYSKLHELDLQGMELRYFAIRSNDTAVLMFTEVEVLGTQLED